jgi:hypothetical protein
MHIYVYTYHRHDSTTIITIIVLSPTIILSPPHRFKDFSSDDMIYSINLRIPFYTPEMLFKNAAVNYKELQGVRVPRPQGHQNVPFSPNFPRH